MPGDYNMPEYKPKPAPKFELGPKKKVSPKYIKVKQVKPKKIATTTIQVKFEIKNKKGTNTFDLKVPADKWGKLKTLAAKKKYVKNEIAQRISADPEKVLVKSFKPLPKKKVKKA